MVTVYFVLALIKDRDIGGLSMPPIHISASVTIIEALILMFLPSYFAGILVCRTEELKVILHNILLHEEDAIRSRDLKRFIRYIEVRPFKFTICKIIPMDWTLPVLVLNISVTYLIVAIQFTKLY
nr:uncharacterized protein LOC128678498 [Plodia interpunctella]